MGDSTDFSWWIAIVLGPVLLAAAFAYGILRNRKAGGQPRIGDPTRSHADSGPVVRNATQARQGQTMGVTRYVLGFGLPAVIVAMILVYLLVAP